MSKKDSGNHLTIEGHLEHHYKKEKHTDRNEILWHAWCQNKRWLSQLLEITMSSFPTFSKHDASHAQTVLHNIELVLGKKRIRELSASDCFVLLHTVYIHDIGMVITHEDRKEIVQNKEFMDMIKEMEDENDPVFQRALKALEQTDYTYDSEEGREKQQQRLYSDKLAVYYAVLHLVAKFRRSEHGELSQERLTKWTLDSEKLGSGFSMAGIPQRIFLWIARCAGLHTDGDFEHIMELPQEDNGYALDYLHPRFIAVLLQLGDILDMDNDRFHPLTRECIDGMPELSERHYEKHQSIRKLYIKPDTISIEADCQTQESLRLVRKECDMLKNILKEAGYYWAQICPADTTGSLPTIKSVKLYLKGTQIPEELITTQFKITQQKAFAILEGSNVYKEQFVFLREFLQNAIDASKLQYWRECIRTRGYYTSYEDMKNMSPDELGEILSTDIFPIEVEMEIVRRNEWGEMFSVNEKDIDRLKKKKAEGTDYGVKVRIKDFGTGIDKESIQGIASVGDSRKQDWETISEMPEWLKPTAEFGIGLQSAFLLTNVFKCNTHTRSNEKYEITFTTVKSKHYEGYINVQPVSQFHTRDDAYGTCFEIFVPCQKKLRHELYPAAWDGKDYFDADYEELRPLRHSAELLAQMALYLDELIGEQLFPVHLCVKDIKKELQVIIPLNLTRKNQLKRLKYHTKADSSVLSQPREWGKAGKSWIYFYHRLLEKSDVVVEKTDDGLAMLDCGDGHLYYWDNKLCVFSLINMENFLAQERHMMESPDKHCENLFRGVRIYYKGIELEERELPGLGNELFQYIEIEGKLDRKYMNLSRKGFTENGAEYFIKEIYYPLLDSILNILKQMGKNCGEAIIQGVKKALKDKKEKLELLMKKIEKSSNPDGTVEHLLKEKQMLVTAYKESVISITMLAFFAQKETFDPVSYIGHSDDAMKTDCWSQVIESVIDCCGSGKNLSDSSGQSVASRDKWLENSVLFHIEHRPPYDLSDGTPMGDGTSGVIIFPEIFSDRYQFIIISKREDKSAPWKQYLVPVWIAGCGACTDENKNLIYLLKKYLIMNDFSENRDGTRDQILGLGANALWIANMAMGDIFGSGDVMSSNEYLQQYFLKWLLRYIPTIALFMSRDGNTRVNVIHGKNFPSIFMNDAVKGLIIRRILDEAESYDIQRFSVPAWQGMEYLSCSAMPYTHYFVKRGYLSRESCSQVIFPFSKEEFQEMLRQIGSAQSQDIIRNLKEICGFLNIRRYLAGNLEELIDKIRMDYLIDEYVEGDKEKIKLMYEQFINDPRNRRSRIVRFLDRVRIDHRSLVAREISTLQQSLDECEIRELSRNTMEEWKKIYGLLFLQTVCNRNLEEPLKIQWEKLKDDLTIFAKAWRYVIERRYLQSTQNVINYKKGYLKEIEKGSGTVYDKRKRILMYIEKFQGNRFRRDYLENSWRQYTEELFGLFQKMEEEQYQVFGELDDDCEAIAKMMHDILMEKTNDADTGK